MSLVPLSVSGFTLAAVAGCLAILLRAASYLRQSAVDPAEENTRFIHYMAGSIAALALVAVIWETLPVFIIPICN